MRCAAHAEDDLARRAAARAARALLPRRSHAAAAAGSLRRAAGIRGRAVHRRAGARSGRRRRAVDHLRRPRWAPSCGYWAPRRRPRTDWSACEALGLDSRAAPQFGAAARAVAGGAGAARPWRGAATWWRSPPAPRGSTPDARCAPGWTRLGARARAEREAVVRRGARRRHGWPSALSSARTPASWRTLARGRPPEQLALAAALGASDAGASWWSANCAGCGWRSPATTCSPPGSARAPASGVGPRWRRWTPSAGRRCSTAASASCARR